MILSGEDPENPAGPQTVTLKLKDRLAGLVGTAILQSIGVPNAILLPKSFTDSEGGDRYSFSLVNDKGTPIIRLQVQEGYVGAGFAHERSRSLATELATKSFTLETARGKRKTAEVNHQRTYARVQDQAPPFVYEGDEELEAMTKEVAKLEAQFKENSEASVPRTRFYLIRLDGMSVEAELASL